jgi:Holliday junction resolvase
MHFQGEEEADADPVRNSSWRNVEAFQSKSLPKAVNPMSNKTRGCNYERQLVDLLYERGFAAVRVAGSGAKPLPTPDIVACRKGKILAIECKTTRKNQVYLKDDQVDDLKAYSKTAGAEPLLAIKFLQQKWFFLKPSRLPRTNGSTLVVSREFVAKRGVTIAELDPLIS